jgi:DNA-binding beta-propeller fold protein YncE
MAKTSITASPPRSIGAGRILTWVIGLLCFGVLAFLLLQIGIQLVTPPPVSRVQLVRDVPLPGILMSQDGRTLPQSVRFDRFDFQALDPQTGLLFTAHDGPSAAKFPLIKGELPAGAVLNPSIDVFDTRQNTYVASINNVNVHGITVASDIHKVYAADAGSSVIRVIDEQACQAAINAGQSVCTVARSIKASQTPDSIEYDADHHEVFVAEPGNLTPSKGVIDVISTQTDTIIKTISMGTDVGHIRYDAATQRAFVVVVPATGNGGVVAIDPLSNTVVARATLPSACTGAHGMAIDESQHVAFVACVTSRNLAMVDLQSMKPIGDTNNLPSLGIKADIAVIDPGLHVLFVGCQDSISVFDESKAASGVLHKFGNYIVSSSSTHSIAVDATTHNIYIPLPDVGSRPAMRVEHYNQNATS